MSRRRDDVRLEIYGDGDELPNLEALVLSEGIASRVTFSGRYLPQRDVLVAVAGADVG